MSNLSFEYDAVDRASPNIDRVTNKLKALKSEYREARRSIGDLKKGLEVMSGLGMGWAAGSMSALGMSKDAKETGPTHRAKSPLYDGLNQGARAASLLAGGAFAGTVLDAFSGSVGRESTRGFSGSSGSGMKSVGSMGKSALDTYLSTLNPMYNMQSWTRQMKAKTSTALPRASSMGRSMAGGSALGMASRAGGFMARMGAGLATGLFAIGAQVAYEVAVEPTIDQFFSNREFTDDFMKSMSSYELNSSKMIKKRIYDESKGKESGQMYFWKSIFGTIDDEQNRMTDQVNEERYKRLSEIKKALYLQNRE
jgi:hypothetical protein